MARIYRHAKAGELPAEVATKLVYILGQIGRVLEIEKVELRLDRLEKLAGGAGPAVTVPALPVIEAMRGDDDD